MERIEIEPRADWQEKVEKLGFGFHTAETTYWNEAAYYQFARGQIDELEAATTSFIGSALKRSSA